jgi:phosphosulfolactate synthase
MHQTALTLPRRDTKPRGIGRTMVIDTGMPTRHFTDVLSSFGDIVDVVKFGWGTSLVTADLKYKIDALRENGVDFYFGGTLFEKFVIQDRFDDWRRFCDRFDARHVEVSNGTIPMSNEEKARYVRLLAPDYTVYSEVGFKDQGRSEQMPAELWISYIRQDLEAGAHTVITESRESGRSGIARSNGELRLDLIEEIAGSGIDVDRLMLEAPTRDLQIALIRRFGANVNLGNIAPADIVGLETLRLGLRADTLTDLDAFAAAEQKELNHA